MVSADFRVTQRVMVDNANWNLQQTYARLQQIQSEISSNRRIQRPSDDPLGASAAMRLKGDLSRSDQIGRNRAPGVKVQFNVTGEPVFGANGNDVFTVLATLANDVRNGNAAAINADITALDTRTQAVQASQADIGARTQRVDTMKDRND